MSVFSEFGLVFGSYLAKKEHYDIALCEKGGSEKRVVFVGKMVKGMERLYYQRLKVFQILCNVIHQNIVSVFSVVEKEDCFFAEMEYCDGQSLQEVLMESGVLMDKSIQSVFHQVCSGISHLHSHGIAHLNVTPDHIVFVSRSQVKIIGFGHSIIGIDDSRENYDGTIAYAPPEAITHKLFLPSNADIWSLGVLLYVISVGKIPWRTDSLNDTLHQISKCAFKVPNSITSQCSSIVQSILKVDIEKRIRMTKLLSDPWLNSGITKEKTTRRNSDAKTINSPTVHHELKPAPLKAIKSSNSIMKITNDIVPPPQPESPVKNRLTRSSSLVVKNFPKMSKEIPNSSILVSEP